MDVNVTLPEPFQPLFKPARYKSYFGGRGSGKSHSMATALLIEGYRTPLRILCCREVQRSIKDSVKQLLDDKIADMGLGWFYTSTRDGIKGQNGTSFIFSGLGNLTAVARERQRLVFEEAAIADLGMRRLLQEQRLLGQVG